MNKYEIKELIGDYLEEINHPNNPEYREIARKYLEEALNGAVPTEDGAQRYYIDLDTLQQENVDLSEAIWAMDANGGYSNLTSDIVYFDEVLDQRKLEPRVILMQDGDLKWKCLKSKIIDKISEFIG